MIARLALLFAVLAVGGCTSNDLPACSWDPALGQGDAAAGTCTTARVLLECAMSDGTSESCLSDTLTSCPGPNPTAAHVVSCTDQCARNEYAATCNTTCLQFDGGCPKLEVPSACRSVGANPLGWTYYCCACN